MMWTRLARKRSSTRDETRRRAVQNNTTFEQHVGAAQRIISQEQQQHREAMRSSSKQVKHGGATQSSSSEEQFCGAWTSSSVEQRDLSLGEQPEREKQPNKKEGERAEERPKELRSWQWWRSINVEWYQHELAETARYATKSLTGVWWVFVGNGMKFDTARGDAMSRERPRIKQARSNRGPERCTARDDRTSSKSH